MPTDCLANEYVLSNTCMACPTGTTNEAGDEIDGDDTACVGKLMNHADMNTIFTDS